MAPAPGRGGGPHVASEQGAGRGFADLPQYIDSAVTSASSLDAPSHPPLEPESPSPPRCGAAVRGSGQCLRARSPGQGRVAGTGAERGRGWEQRPPGGVCRSPSSRDWGHVASLPHSGWFLGPGSPRRTPVSTHLRLLYDCPSLRARLRCQLRCCWATSPFPSPHLSSAPASPHSLQLPPPQPHLQAQRLMVQETHRGDGGDGNPHDPE